MDFTGNGFQFMSSILKSESSTYLFHVNGNQAIFILLFTSNVDNDLIAMKVNMSQLLKFVSFVLIIKAWWISIFQGFLTLPAATKNKKLYLCLCARLFIRILFCKISHGTVDRFYGNSKKVWIYINNKVHFKVTFIQDGCHS